MKFVVIIVSVIVVAAAIVAIWPQSKKPRIGSFWDVVRNPDALPDLAQRHKDIDVIASKMSGSEDQIAELVNYFVFEAQSSSDAWTERQTIARLGEEAYPPALEILRDASARKKLVVLTEHEDSLPEAPINRLCEIFDQDAPPPEAADLLAPFLESDSDEIRKSVALIIGSVGSAESIPDLRQVLQDEDEYVKSYALMGIQRAIQGGRIAPSSRDEFYEMVAAMWPGDTSFSVCDSIPQILLQLNRDRAIERLLRPDLFTAQFEPAWRILQAFDEESVRVPRPRLLTLIDEASTEPIESPMGSILEGALSLLGEHRMEEDLPTLERLVDHANEDVSRGAIKGLYKYHRYFDVIRDPWEVVQSDGWDALTEAEKHSWAIRELDGEVNNGGFAQYYFNSSGNHWQDALSGLAAIGAEKHHQLVAATVERFGTDPPSSKRDIRNAQLAEVVHNTEDPFSAQDTAWYKTKDESLDRLMFRYNLATMETRQKTE
jgi:uncharacterized protein DUF4375/HEAT repeat protein